MKMLFVVNDAPYGSERPYNAMRLAANVLKASPAPEVTVFLMADATSAAKAGQQTPNGCKRSSMDELTEATLAAGK